MYYYSQKNTFDSVSALCEGGELTLNAFRSGIFPIKGTKVKERLSDLARVTKVSDRTRLKILTPKQILQRLPIALAQVKTGNTSGNLLNEIRQITYNEFNKVIKQNGYYIYKFWE